MTPVLACGTYLLNLQCPKCSAVMEVAIYLDTRLSVDHVSSSLAAKLGSKPVDHLCGQLRLVTANGELPPENGAADEVALFTPPTYVPASGDMT